MHTNNLIHFMNEEVCRAGWGSYYRYNDLQIRNPALHRLNNTIMLVYLSQGSCESCINVSLVTLRLTFLTSFSDGSM